MTDVLAWVGAIGGAAGGIAGLIALVLSCRANQTAASGNKIAKKGNKIAESASKSASAAVVVAGEANRLAEVANEKSAEANLIAERALRISADNLDYNWVLEVDDDGRASVLNDCAHEAMDVTVVIDSLGEIYDQAAINRVAGFDQVDFEVPRLVQEHFAKVETESVPRLPRSGSGVFIAGSAGSTVRTKVRATVTWSTPEGVPRTGVVNETLSHRKTIQGEAVRTRE